MPIDPGIVGQLKPLNFDGSNIINLLAQGQQRRIALENHQQQTELHNQAIAAGNRAAEAAKIKQRGAEISRQAYIDVKGDPKAHVAKVVEMGGDPDTVMGLQKHYADLDEKVAKIASDQLPVKKYQNEQLAGLTAQEMEHAQADPQGFAAAWPEYVQKHQAISKEESDHLDPNSPPTFDDLKLMAAGHQTLDEFFKAAGEKRAQVTAQQQADEAKRKADAFPTEQAKRVADAQTAADTAAGKKPIQPEEQARIDLQKRSQDEILRHNSQTEKNATALLRVHQAGDARAQQIYEQTYGEGANPALVGVEPKLRVQASSAAQKAADEYTKASEATGNMKSILDLARSGNKIAYAYAPTTGVLTINSAMGVKRVNMAEIKSFGGAGSAADKVEGWLGKQVSGASIPKDILDAMEQVNKSVADGAGNAYNTKLDSINQNYRSNFKPVKVAKPEGGATGGYQVGHLYGGMEFLGGDPNNQTSWKKH